MVLTRGRRRQQAQQQDDEERVAQQARRERIRWVNGVFTKAPVHHLGHFLDRFDFAALQTTSATMQTSLRNVIRAPLSSKFEPFPESGHRQETQPQHEEERAAQ